MTADFPRFSRIAAARDAWRAENKRILAEEIAAHNAIADMLSSGDVAGARIAQHLMGLTGENRFTAHDPETCARYHRLAAETMGRLMAL